MSLIHASPATVCERPRKGRSRPNLSRVCQKTKMCAFHLNGTCPRAEACSFAHDPSELKPKPDLQCTKLCPMLVKTGHCAKIHSCKFAHAESEVQAIVGETMAPEPLDSQCTSHQTAHSSPTSSREVGSSLESISRSVSPASVQLARFTDPGVASHLSVAAESGALSLRDMVLHLTHIFMAVYHAQPETAQQIGMSASLLASATAEQAWSDAGVNRDASMTFGEFMLWCAFPLPRIHAPMQKLESADIHGVHRVDSDTCIGSDTLSQTSTDEGTLWSPTSDGSEVLHSFSDDASEACSSKSHSDVWTYHSDVEITVRNTFLHFEIQDERKTLRRSHSLPCRPCRERCLTP